MAKLPSIVAFERAKIARMIRTMGSSYLFSRDKLNDFKEPTGETSITTVMGIFHREVRHVDVVTGDSASVQTKQIPYILALYDAAKDLKQGDKVTVKDKLFRVTGLVNIVEWDIAIDISLEEVLE